MSKAEKFHQNEDELTTLIVPVIDETRGGFKYLPGTRKEAEMVASRLENEGISTTVYSGMDAQEESFVNLSGVNAPSVIHLATHGYYVQGTGSLQIKSKVSLSGSGDIPFRSSADPLLRSGLLMSGANLAWKGANLPAAVEDGILTAKEVSNLDLKYTQLVVLSACQSGLGDVKGSEGVEGLQRGFKMAGVKYLIMSLWEVPDHETTEFMRTFYDNWCGRTNIRNAFRATQVIMKDKYKNEPHKWAGFVLFE